MAQLLDLVNRCAVLRRVCRRLLIPSRGPLKRLVWCQFRISSAQLRMVFAVCRTREWPRSRIGQRSVQECPGHSGGHRPDKGRRALVERPRPPEDTDKFQQDLLKRVALDYPISFSTPIELSSLFGASIHATFRRWLEGLDAAACGLVLDANLTQGRRKRYEQVLTTQWKQQFGPYRFPRMMSTTSYPFASQELSKGTFHIDDRDGTPIKLRYETFRTPYRQFALLWLPKQQSFLARHRKQPVILLA